MIEEEGFGLDCGVGWVGGRGGEGRGEEARGGEARGGEGSRIAEAKRETPRRSKGGGCGAKITEHAKGNLRVSKLRSRYAKFTSIEQSNVGKVSKQSMKSLAKQT